MHRWKHPVAAAPLVRFALLILCASAAFCTSIALGADAATQPNPLDADRAFGYLKRLCDLGPRPSGSPAMLKQQGLLVEHFERLDAKVELQRFAARNPRGGRVKMANIIARYLPDAKRRVVLCAHYDTRPFPDRDPNPVARTRGRFLGASDGASGTAVLMELAHHMRAYAERHGDAAVGVDLVMLDGEELVYVERRDPYFLGSTWFAQQYLKRKGGWSYEAAVLFDMVGDADLQVHQEWHSATWPESRPLMESLWRTADRIGVKEFVPTVKHSVQDDHLPLRNIGKIPAVDLIDFDYPYWHTEADTPRKCSGESLAKVGWVVLEWLNEVGSGQPAVGSEP
ncbi:MAG: M28 family peptidase [Lacipirellulaceae bacterium]